MEHSLAQVTQLKEQLRHQAYHDALTGLPNRLHLLEAVEQELGRGTGSTAVLYLDLDRFKSVNDTWGHSAGDELLTEFARRLSGAIRAQDLAARLGGDEFAVLVRDADSEAAIAAARRMLEALDGTYALGCGDVACHVSVGIAVGGVGETSGEDLIRNADIAMYSVKQSDRAYTLYEAELHEKLRAQRQLVLRLDEEEPGDFPAVLRERRALRRELRLQRRAPLAQQRDRGQPEECRGYVRHRLGGKSAEHIRYNEKQTGYRRR